MGYWAPLGTSKFRYSYDGETWWLERTPKGRRPWLLYTEVEEGNRIKRVREQEIGAQDLEAAKHAAEMWLGMANLVRDTGHSAGQ